jgi:alpha-glucosidase
MRELKMTARPEWWKKAVIYQIYPRSFKDTTGNGIGDLAGITLMIPYLADTLGIDAIWISPFYPSPMKDFGYDVANYRDIDPIFGTMADFDHLIETIHNANLKLIIDLVPNHSSDQHPWFLESRSSITNPKRDWYIWENARDDGSPPNNWLSVFGGEAWEWDPNTEQYYLHSFLKEQPDLNWRNSQVQEAIFDEVRFWLDKGVDGFRIDVAHYLMKDPELKDNPLNQSRSKSIHKPLGEYDTQIHLFDKGHPDIHRVYRDFRKLLDGYSKDQPRMSMGEIHIFDLDEWVKYYGENLDEIHFPINFTLLGADWQAGQIRDLVESLESSLPSGAWPNYVLANHDDLRILTRYGKEAARSTAMLLLTLRGTPILYYGDEIGMKDVEIPPELCLDPAGIRQEGQGRDPNRTPMQWSDDTWAGFSPPEAKKTWLPIADDYQDINVKTLQNDSDSILSFYQNLLKIRKLHPALQTGDYHSLPEVPDGVYLYTRQNEEEQILIAINFTSLEQIVEDPRIERGTLLLSSLPGRAKFISTPICLKPNESLMVQL